MFPSAQWNFTPQLVPIDEPLSPLNLIELFDHFGIEIDTPPCLSLFPLPSLEPTDTLSSNPPTFSPYSYGILFSNTILCLSYYLSSLCPF